jgi:hypothetical protein
MTILLVYWGWQAIIDNSPSKNRDFGRYLHTPYLLPCITTLIRIRGTADNTNTMMNPGSKPVSTSDRKQAIFLIVASDKIFRASHGGIMC